MDSTRTSHTREKRVKLRVGARPKHLPPYGRIIAIEPNVALLPCGLILAYQLDMAEQVAVAIRKLRQSFRQMISLGYIEQAWLTIALSKSLIGYPSVA